VSFRLEQLNDLRTNGAAVPTYGGHGAFEVSGRHGQGSVAIRIDGQNLAFDVRFVGSDIWTRLQGAEWHVPDLGIVHSDDIWNIWQYLPPMASMTTGADDSVGGHFESSRLIPYHPGLLLGGGGGSIRHTDLYLSPDGHPTRIVWRIEGATKVDDKPVFTEGNLDVKFLDWGATLAIEPPPA
jgi:hypothetical protein